jgi:acetolactate synthase I/II/III large subunit
MAGCVWEEVVLKTGAAIIWETLERLGVTTVFGYPGGAVLPLYDALTRSTIHHVLVRHEQGAAHMADGYARAGVKIGVAIATSGPGATNLVTGIATAMMDSSPVMFITGQVNSKLIGTNAFQETNITAVTQSITKYNCLVTRVEDICPAIRRAFCIATTGRPGPVLIDITKDAQQASYDFEWAERDSSEISVASASTFSESQLHDTLSLIHHARRPLILAGHGILLSGAVDEFRRFVERNDIPVAMTLLGIGSFPASHPLNLGMMGMHGELWVNQAIQQADLLLAFGMRFDDRVTGDPSRYALQAKKVHIDIDAREINKIVPVDIGLVGDLRELLQILLTELRTQKRPEWNGHIGKLKGKCAVRDILNLPANGHLYAPHVIHDLWCETRGADVIIASDVGQHQMWEAQYFKHELPRSLITSGGLGTMGFALPAALGAKLARPQSQVWVVVGDGGFQMTMAELATIVQEKLDIKIAIINNKYLGMVRQWQELFYEGRYSSTPLLSPNFGKLAEAFGIANSEIRRREEVVPAVRAARSHPGPVLLDFQVEAEDSVYPMVSSGAALDEMIQRPSIIIETATDP